MERGIDLDLLAEEQSPQQSVARAVGFDRKPRLGILLQKVGDLLPGFVRVESTSSSRSSRNHGKKGR